VTGYLETSLPIDRPTIPALHIESGRFSRGHSAGGDSPVPFCYFGNHASSQALLTTIS
jgi:hypothetical protein